MLTESEPHYRQPLLKTPFHERSRAASQVDSFVPWSGAKSVTPGQRVRVSCVSGSFRKGARSCSCGQLSISS